MKQSVDIPIKGPVIKDPKILGGTPVIKGSRVPAALLLDLVSRGYSIDLIKQEYPTLTSKRVKAFFTLMSKSFDVSAPNSL